MKNRILLGGTYLLIVAIGMCGVSCKHKVQINKYNLDWNKPVECKYQEGQIIGNKSIETNSRFIFKNYRNSTELTWTLYDLMTNRPYFISDGDKEGINVRFIKGSTVEGMIFQVPQRNGNHNFVIWQDGTSFWNKINDIFGMKASQQFLGVCRNI